MGWSWYAPHWKWVNGGYQKTISSKPLYNGPAKVQRGRNSAFRFHLTMYRPSLVRVIHFFFRLLRFQALNLAFHVIRFWSITGSVHIPWSTYPITLELYQFQSAVSLLSFWLIDHCCSELANLQTLRYLTVAWYGVFSCVLVLGFNVRPDWYLFT